MTTPTALQREPRSRHRSLADRLDRQIAYLHAAANGLRKSNPATAAVIDRYVVEVSGIVEELKAP